MMNGRPPDIAAGGACAWQLPPDATGPALARSLLAGTLNALGLPDELICDAVLAVSETATNAYQHATQTGPHQPSTPPELWIWARTAPIPQMVVSVFDTNRADLPQLGSGYLLDEHGKGLGILTAVCTAWGSHWTRSRLTPHPVPGKTVWFSLPLPQPWPETDRIIAPSTAARKLLMTLAARGIEGTGHSDDKGISIIELPTLNVWVEPKAFSWQNPPGKQVRHPLLDLQDTAEHLIHHIEQHNTAPAAP